MPKAAAPAASSFAAPSALVDEGWHSTWLDYKKTSEDNPVLSAAGTVLAENQQMTYLPWWRLDLGKDSDGRVVLIGTCKARTHDGATCEVENKMTYGNTPASFEFGNAMRHLVRRHPWLINVDHHHLFKEKGGKDEEEEEVTFSREVVKKQKGALVKLIATGGYPLSTYTSLSLPWTEYCATMKMPAIPRSTLQDAYAAQIVDLVKKPREKMKALIEEKYDVYGMSLTGRVAIISDGYKARNGENKTAIHL